MRDATNGIESTATSAVAEDEASGSSVEDGQVAAKTMDPASKKTTKKKETLDSSWIMKKTTTDVLNTLSGSVETPGTLKKEKNRKSSTKTRNPKSISKGLSEESNCGPKTVALGEIASPSLVSAAKDDPAELGYQEPKSKKTEIEEDDNVATELDTNPEEILRRRSQPLQNTVDVGDSVFKEASKTAGTYSTVVSSRTSDSESNPEDTSNDDAVTSKLMRLLEEREESLKQRERRIVDQENAVERQADLHNSLQSQSLKEHERALQQSYAGYEALQQELVKEKQKVTMSELSFKELKEDMSALQKTYAGYEALQQELAKEREKVAEKELSIQALKEDASAHPDTDAGYEKLQQELIKEREKVIETELSIQALKEDASALPDTDAGYEVLQQELVKEREKVAERECSIRLLKEHECALQATCAGYGELQQELVKEREKVGERELIIKALKEDASAHQENDAGYKELQQQELVKEREKLAEREEEQSTKEYLECEVFRLRANAKKLVEKSNATQELLQLWTEEENEMKLGSDAAGDQLVVDSPVLTDEMTQAGKNTKVLAQGKGWGLGGVFRSARNLDDEEAEAAGNQLDVGSPVLTDDVTQAVENMKALPQGKTPQALAASESNSENGKNVNKGNTWGISGMFSWRAKNLDDEEAEADGKHHDAGSPDLTDVATQEVENTEELVEDMLPEAGR
jgi:hypothetical protein